MIQETYDLIIATLQTNFDELSATKKYLKHQLTLPREHRVMTETDQEAEDALKQINPQIQNYAEAITQLRAVKNVIISEL